MDRFRPRLPRRRTARRKLRPSAAARRPAGRWAQLRSGRGSAPWRRRPPTWRTPPEKPAKPSPGLWFRFSTRVAAIGYWVREKSQPARRAGRRLGTLAGGLWTGRSRTTRVRLLAVLGVLALYAIVKFTPVPIVPCGISAVRECAPENESIELVPASALLYGQVTLDEETDQFKRAEELGDRLPQLTELTGRLSGLLPAPSGAAVDLREHVLPWAKRELGVLMIPGPAEAEQTAVIAGVGDRQGAEEFLAMVAPSGERRSESQNGSPLTVYPEGFASAYIEDSLVVGDEAAVRAALDAGADRIPRLDGSAQEQARDELPQVRFAELYLSREGIARLLEGRQGGATQLETFVDYRASTGMAAAAVTRDDGVEIDLVSELDPDLLGASPSFFSELPLFEPGLTERTGSRALGYVGIGEIGPTLGGLLSRAGQANQGLAGALQRLAAQLRKEAGVDPLGELLPALGGQAALIAEPTDGVPFASLIVDGVDEDAASEALARLQRPVLRALGAGGGGSVPRFEEEEVEGTTVRSIQLSPTVNLSYAVFDGMLVVSTDPAGIAQARSDGDRLAGSEAFEAATDDLPDEVSALVFLNLDELLGQVGRTDLVEDPFFASLSVNLDNIRSAALAVEGSDHRIRSELFMALDD